MKREFVVLHLLLSGLAAAAPTITFEKEDGEGRQVAATVVIEEGVLASVAVLGSDPTRARIGTGEEAQFLSLVIRDEVSRLTLLKVPEGVEVGDAIERGASLNLQAGDAVFLDPEDQERVSRVVSWENKYGETVLPLSLIRVHHPGQEVPPPGTPLFDRRGRLVALCHQAAAEFGLGTYALPVETIARVEKDLKTSGKFVSSWIGIRMDVKHPVLSIMSVRPESPAAAAGILKGDILLAVGKREVRTYADAVNALYYLVNGEETVVRVLRGTTPMEMTVVPVVSPVTPTPAPVPE